MTKNLDTMDLNQFLVNYHIGEETTEEHKFFDVLLKKTHAKYPSLKGNLDVSFNKEGKDYSPKERKEITYRIAKSVFRNIVVAQKPKDIDSLDMQHILKKIKKELIETLPFYLDNDETFYSNRGFVTEPPVIYAYHIITSIQKEINKQDIKGIESEEDKLVIYTINNILRAIKSSLVLFAIGDDVHAMATTRGMIELFARLSLMNDENIKDALYFSHINSLLQVYKADKSKTKTMSPELKEFLDKNNLSKSTAEMFLLNGWAKDKKGKPIIQNTQLLKEAFKTNFENYNQLYHICSEFVHEDYALANYDFITLREEFKIFLANMVYSFEDLCQSIGIKAKGWQLLGTSIE